MPIIISINIKIIIIIIIININIIIIKEDNNAIIRVITALYREDFTID